MDNKRKKDLLKQGYRIIGNHSAIKICLWCKKSINNQDVCYKNKFYGINSWQCIQSSITLDYCNLKCQWCWRDINLDLPKIKLNDSPKKIVDGLVKEQREILQGFYGNKQIDKKKLNEAMNPKHIALSLTGDACLYPKLPEIIDEIHKRNMTSFLVTNGTFPSMIKKLINHQPTQIYITLAAPNKEIFCNVCQATEKQWDSLFESLKLLKHFKRSTIRLTLAKDINFLHPEQYSSLINNIDFDFLEIKAAMPIGYARQRMEYSQMPTHQEIKIFTQKISSLTNFKIVDEKDESKVVLLMKDNFDRRFLDLN